MWHLLAFHGAKWHVCPEELVRHIMDDLEVRGCSGTVARTRVQDFCLDHGGPLWMGRSYQEVEIDGLRIEVPVAELAAFVAQLRRLPPREINDRPYYKLHGYVHCIVLTPAQRDALLQTWTRALQTVEVQAVVDRLETRRCLQALSDHPNIKIDAPPEPQGVN